MNRRLTEVDLQGIIYGVLELDAGAALIAVPQAEGVIAMPMVIFIPGA